MSEMPPTPSGTPRYTAAQRRLLTVSGGLGVAVLAGLAFVVTYGDLRALALAGHAPRRFATAYPVMFDALITVTILALVVARNGRWWARWTRWPLLLALLAGAAAASLQRATKGYAALSDEVLKAGTAVAPHVMLLLAIWLWLGMFKQARTALARRPAVPVEGPPPGREGPSAETEPGDRSGSADYDQLVPGPHVPGPHVPGPHESGPHVPEQRPSREHSGEYPPGDADETTWPTPWIAQEAPLDWALVPYDAEPAPPYEPDPAVQPYEPDPGPVRSRQPGGEPIEPYGAVEHEPGTVGDGDVGSDHGEGTDTPQSAAEEVFGEEEVSAPAPSSLPGDIKLVGRPAATTRPDLVVSGTVEPATPSAEPSEGPAAEPVPDSGRGGDGDDHEDGADIAAADRPEDPDAGIEWRPPSGTFRSSPTPPDN